MILSFGLGQANDSFLVLWGVSFFFFFGADENKAHLLQTWREQNFSLS